jgi:hypothetical protein
MMSRTKRLLVVPAFALLLAGCRQDMQNTPRANTFRPSPFYDDQLSARQPVWGTVAQSEYHTDDLLYTGMVNGRLSQVFPFPVTRQVIERGRERFNIYCSPCHGLTGDGDGMIVRRGFRQPPSFHIDRLRKAPVGHFFDVITHGFGSMYDYGDRVGAHDRWAIIAYIRALQLSRNATLADVPPAQRAFLSGGSK